MRRLRDPHKENLDRWLLTYADLITLLLCFFIMMYTLSQADAERFRSLAKALGQIFSEQRVAPQDELLRVKEEMDRYIKEKGLEGWVKAVREDRGLVIRIMTTSFFREGSAELTPDMKAVLDELAPMLKRIPNFIQVEGHTDNKPIRNARFKSNWELSVARATVVVQYLIERHGIPPERIAAIGYGEYRPIASNDTEIGRAKNRRVEIVILDRGGGRGADRSQGSPGAHSPPGEAVLQKGGKPLPGAGEGAEEASAP